MKKYEIKMSGKIEVEANSLEEALEKFLQKLDKKWFGCYEMPNEEKIPTNELVYGYNVWYCEHIVGDNGEIDFDTGDKAKQDAQKYIKDGLLEEYNETDESKFTIEIISYRKD